MILSVVGRLGMGDVNDVGCMIEISHGKPRLWAATLKCVLSLDALFHAVLHHFVYSPLGGIQRSTEMAEL